MEWEKSEKCLSKLLSSLPYDESGEKKCSPKMKYTIPGPMTLVDILYDDYYGQENQREMIADLISCVNKVGLFI